MASQYPFPHDSIVHLVADERFEVAYYSYGYLKYKRVREVACQSWDDTIEQQIDADSFWMVVACIQRARGVRDGLA